MRAVKFYAFEMAEYQNTKESVLRRRKEIPHMSYGKNNSMVLSKRLNHMLDNAHSSQQHHYRKSASEVQGVVSHDALREGIGVLCRSAFQGQFCPWPMEAVLQQCVLHLLGNSVVWYILRNVVLLGWSLFYQYEMTLYL